jgi:hypothetical protein
MWLLVDGALLLSLTMGAELFLYLRRREHHRDAVRIRRIARLLARDVRTPQGMADHPRGAIEVRRG